MQSISVQQERQETSFSAKEKMLFPYGSGSYNTVDDNTTNNDSSADVGNETNFDNAQDISPDSDYMNIQENDTGGAGVDEWLENDADAEDLGKAEHSGASIYLQAVDGDNILTITGGGGYARWYTFSDTGDAGTYTVNISVYFISGDGNDDLDWEIDTDGDDVAEYSGQIANPVSGWYTDSVGSLSQEEVNSARAMLEGIADAGYTDPDIDAVRLGVNQAGGTNYNIDFEYNWSTADFDEENEEVCIYYAEASNLEDLNVSYWNTTGANHWTKLGNITGTTGWKNFTADGLNSSSYTIRINGTNEISDATQDDFDFDVIMLHTWYTNSPPTFSGEIPANQSTGISLQPVCNITANDADGGDTLTVYFYENTTGDWVLQQTNSSVSPGTIVYWDNYSNASSENTMYWWSVNCTDATDWNNETYYFTTGGWWDTDWSYFKTITIESDLIETTLENFPILLNSTDTDMIGKGDNGDSVRFLSTDNSTEFIYEIEEWTDSGFSIHVNISEKISAGSDYKFLMYYGNSSAIDNQNKEGVWDSNYVFVSHMNDSTTSTIVDSTAYSNDGTKESANSPLQARGKIGFAQDFDNTDDLIDGGSDGSLDLTGEITVEGWYDFDSIAGDYDYIIRKNDAYNVYLLADGLIRLMYYDVSGTRYYRADARSVGITCWYYLAQRFDTSNEIEYFINASKDVGSETSSAVAYSNTGNLYIGANTGGPINVVEGRIDEFRISDIARNDSWLKASFHTTNQTTGFLTWGGEQTNLINQPPTVESPNPANGGEGVSTSLSQLSVWVNDTEGDGINWTIETSPNIGSQDNSTAEEGNGSKVCTVSGLQTHTIYTWYVNTTDNGSDSWTNKTYTFTTANAVPVVSNEYPANGSTDIPLTPTLQVQINDTDAEQMNITWMWWNYTEDYFATDSFYLGLYKLNMQQGIHINQDGYNHTYICYMGQDGTNYDPRIIMYNHTSDEWTTSVLLDEIVANSKGGPSMFINDSGYIHVYYDFHVTGTAGKIKISKNPYDIGTSASDWNTGTWTGGVDYPCYVHAINVGNDEIYVFYRYFNVDSARHWRYMSSSDGGDTWSSPFTYLDTTDGHLGESYMYGMKYYNDKIHMVWNDMTHEGSSAIENVYYMYLNITDEHLYNVTDVDLGTAVTTEAEIDSCLVYDSSSSPYKYEALAGRVDVDTNENPYIIFMYANANDEDHYSWNFTYWNGTGWDVDPATGAPWNITNDSVIRDSSSGTVTVYSPTDIRMYVPVNRSSSHPVNNPGGDIEQWDWDGTSLVFNTTVMAEDDYSKPLNMGPVIQDAINSFRFIACEYDLSGTASPRLFGWGKDNTFVRGTNKTWYTFGTNTSVNNGTYYQENSNFSELDTVYHWSVNVTDGYDWINESYYFVTEVQEANNPPTQSGEVPSNGSTDISLTPNLYVLCNDVDASDEMNATWWSNSTIASENWYDTTFNNRKLITINSSQIVSTLTNFPVLISIADSDLISHAQPDGDDIFFVLYSDNSTKLNHEIEKYTSGNLEAWVNVTSLSSTVDTLIWMYYGNTSCSSQEDVTGTWDSKFVGVWHMNDLTTSTILDSTSYDNDGAKTSANNPLENESGKIGNAQTYNQNDDINCGNDAEFNFSNETSFTVEAWYYMNTDYTGHQDIVRKGGTPRWVLYWKYDQTFWRMLTYDGSTYGYAQQTDASPESKWIHLVGTMDGATSVVELFLDGASVHSDTAYNCSDPTINLFIGFEDGNYLNGTVDEVRISNIQRSDDWINTTYNTTNNPTTFHYVSGNEETYSSGGWVQFASNETSFADGTNITQSNSNFSVYSTTYYWSVNLTDGTDWINETYHFTTEIEPTVDVDINRSSFAFGTVQPDNVVYSNGTGKYTFKIYNNGTVAVDMDIRGTNATVPGFSDWVLSSDNGANLTKLEIYNDSTGWFQINLTQDTWYSNFGALTNITANLRITTPTIFYTGKQRTLTIYMTASIY